MKKLIICILFVSFVQVHASTLEKPRLILQIVIDQLRGDLIYLHQNKFSTNGFNYLINHGIDYHNTHHPHANTSTCPGHATIATGSYPAMHGLVHNHWFDRKTKQTTYCVEDQQSPLLSTNHTEVIPEGRSPVKLMASTVSDEIMLSKLGRSFGVSLKDRGAITLGGHAGKAYWLDKKNGGFVSSTWYMNQYPEWVQEWNKKYKPQEVVWTLSQPQKSYIFANEPIFKHRFPDFGFQFPHRTGTPQTKRFYKYFSMTPKADRITAEFAEHLLINEQLGKAKNKTDYLGISFSATDAIGHQFGPNSLESEDNIIQLDKTIAHLLEVVDNEVGLDRTLIVLTADHGVSDTPAYLNQHNIKKRYPVHLPQLKKTIRKQLEQRFGLPKNTLTAIDLPYVYLNQPVIHKHKLDPHQVSHYLAEILTQYPGIYKAYTLPTDANENDWISSKVDKMPYPYRAGDLYLISPPFQSYAEKGENRVDHGTPWKYDSYVPLLFVNLAFKQQRINRAVSTTDIASTLTKLLVIKPPSAAVGQPLPEVLTYYMSNQE